MSLRHTCDLHFQKTESIHSVEYVDRTGPQKSHRIIADANLPFAIIERSSFINLLGACNGNVPQMMVKADAIQNHLF